MAIPLIALAIGSAIGAGVGMAMSPIMAALEPFMQDIRQRAWAFHPIRQLTEAQLIELYYRGKLSEDELKRRLKELGYDEQKADELIEIAKRLLTAEELVVAKWRGIIDEEEYYDRMSQLGFEKEDADKFEAIRKFYPTPSDWIRFAVRDVFNESIVKKYGYDEDFPEAIVEHVKKAGMTEEQIRWYWRAHWELPSPHQGYEMLHRLNPEVMAKLGEKYKEMGLNPEEIKTDLNTLRELLRVADYPKYWRDRLIAIAYNPLTRVDLRRIYIMGLIDDDELIARLMELGYTKKDAELLAQWYKMLKHEDGLNITRSMLKKAFKEGMITENEYRKYLKELGYDDDEIEFIVKLAAKEKLEDEIDEKLKAYIYMYRAGKLTYDELKNKIDDLPISEARKEYWLAKAELEREKAQKLPSKSDLIKWLKLGIIDENEFKEIMSRLGYSEKYIEYYIKEAGL